MKKRKVYTFHIEIMTDGINRADAWLRLLVLMDKAGFLPKPKNLKRTHSHIKGKGK